MGWLFGSSSSFDEAKSARAYRDYFVGKCGACTYLNPKDYTSGIFSGYKYKCLNGQGYQPWDSRRCSRYDDMPPDKRDYAELYHTFTGRRYYYILTAICEVLGVSLESDLFKEIKTLIQLVRSDESTLKEAVGYHTFGEEIAENLVRDPNAVSICNFLLTNYLTKVYLLIKENKQEEAIEVYKQMVIYLYGRYQNQANCSTLISEEAFENIKIPVKK